VQSINFHLYWISILLRFEPKYKKIDAMKTKQGNVTTMVLILITIAAITFAAYLLGQNKQLKDSGSNSAVSVEISPGPTVEDLQIDINDENQTFPLQPTQPAPTSVVVFEASGSIPSADKAQLMERVVEPFVDYYKEQDRDRHIVSLSIGKNTGASQETYPYQGKAIFSDGVNSGFLIAKKSGSIEWWLPECMKCEFSSDFSSKYPAIVAQFNQ